MDIDYLTKILEILKDTKEYNIEIIENEIHLPREVVFMLLKFLQEQSFIENSNGTLKISSKGLRLLTLPSGL